MSVVPLNSGHSSLQELGPLCASTRDKAALTEAEQDSRFAWEDE
jgi:hypothetical protein